MRYLSAHQPVYLPGLILFNKIALSDVFVFLSDVQFKRRSWHVRNHVRNGDQAIWLSVAVDKASGQSNTIRQTGFGDTDWKRKHLVSLQMAYGSRPFFKTYFPAIADLIQADYPNLAMLNITLIRHFCMLLELQATLIDSAELDHCGDNQDRLISLCHAAEAEGYISNIGAAAYVDEAGFTAQGITHVWQAFTPPVYEQGKAFLPNLSIVDALFNLGPQTAELVRTCGHRTPDLQHAQAAMDA